MSLWPQDLSCYDSQRDIDSQHMLIKQLLYRTHKYTNGTFKDDFEAEKFISALTFLYLVANCH